MAIIETLRWGLELLWILAEHTCKPLTMEKLRRLYPDMPRTTLLNRMESVVAASYAIEVDGGWIIHPDRKDLFERMQKGTLSALIESATRAQTYGLHT
jgi:hypothetical protein